MKSPRLFYQGLGGIQVRTTAVRSLTLTGSVQAQRIFAWTIRRTEDSTTFGEVVLCPAYAVYRFFERTELKAVHERVPILLGETGVLDLLFKR